MAKAATDPGRSVAPARDERDVRARLHELEQRMDRFEVWARALARHDQVAPKLRNGSRNA